jgi:hypothetical protein
VGSLWKLTVSLAVGVICCWMREDEREWAGKDLEGDTCGHLNELWRPLSGKQRKTRNLYVGELATLV